MANNDSLTKRLRAVLDEPETGPTLRRFFVNTIFDSTFVILGILIASAFSSDPNLRIVIVTITTSSVALGISTGISVFEAETMEQSIKMKEMERAMLTSLEDTHLHKVSRLTIMVIAVVNFTAPILAGAVTLTPFLVMGENDIRTAAYISLGLAITILFVVGAAMGRAGGRNPLAQGARMAVAGIAAFLLCFWIESLL
ncbi:MAG: VIT1/CCC1 transporter family protein [Methanomassiliicoccus sp.]|nr:VIT1/CCC1 transporter family protein [Methanomassiliicoccus sp.]